jgi:hypothetical protein
MARPLRTLENYIHELLPSTDFLHEALHSRLP